MNFSDTRQTFFEMWGIDYMLYRTSVKSIHARMRKERSQKDVIKTAVNGAGYGHYHISAIQLENELSQVLKFLEQNSVSNVMEIGTQHGGTLYAMAKGIETTENLVSVDEQSCGRRREKKFYRKLLDEDLTFVRGNSHTEKTKSELQDKIGDRKFDFLFIDGDHSYDGVKQDLLDYAEFVAEDGWIGFHDIVCHTDRWEVHKFWKNEIKPNFEVKEFVDQQRTIEDVTKEDMRLDGHGIGLLQKKEFDREKIT